MVLGRGGSYIPKGKQSLPVLSGYAHFRLFLELGREANPKEVFLLGLPDITKIRNRFSLSLARLSQYLGIKIAEGNGAYSQFVKLMVLLLTHLRLNEFLSAKEFRARLISPGTL